jgi:phosphomannomutase
MNIFINAEVVTLSFSEEINSLAAKYIREGDHSKSDYFSLIKEYVSRRNRYETGSNEFYAWQDQINGIYELIRDEIVSSNAKPATPVKFGTSGWRGVIGKDLTVKSVRQVTQAIISMYHEVEANTELSEALGVKSMDETRARGCVVGFDNRFGGELFGKHLLSVELAGTLLLIALVGAIAILIQGGHLSGEIDQGRSDE